LKGIETDTDAIALKIIKFRSRPDLKGIETRSTLTILLMSLLVQK